MHINILIAEDDILIAENIKMIIEKIYPEINIFISGFAAEALEYAKDNPIDLFCLDIQLEDSNGIELAKNIRVIPTYTLTPIIFITAIPTKELIAFKETHCYDYIVKPFLEKDLHEKLQTIIKYYKDKQLVKTNQELKLRFKGKSCVYSIFQKDIMFIESQMRRLYVVTTKEKFTSNIMSLHSLAGEFGNDFIQCHKSFFVNQNFIQAIDFAAKEIVLENKQSIPIGRKYLENLKESHHESF